MKEMVNSQNNPIIVFCNVFGSENQDTIPNVHVISFLAYDEEIPRGGHYTKENICIITHYKGETIYQRLDWVDKEGINRSRLIPPFEIWKSDYLDVMDLRSYQGKKIKSVINCEIEDIFLKQAEINRRLCHFTPLKNDDQYKLQLKIFDPGNRSKSQFLNTFLVWNPENKTWGITREYRRRVPGVIISETSDIEG